MNRTLLFFISLLFASLSLWAQEETVVSDTISKNEKYGLRVGGDISKLARTAFDKKYTGFELMGDLRFSKQFYAAIELGNENIDFEEDNLTANSKGSYIKIGADYNSYKNWLGMENAIFTGLRYGFSTFSQELTSYRASTTNPTFPSETITTPQEFNNLNASWVELIFGVKTEIANNLYLSINVQLKHKITETEPDNFGNLIIPGFNKTNDFSKWGVGYGYTISYLIPIINR
jgi:hypothetical protein